jgi:hypothetical protein
MATKPPTGGQAAAAAPQSNPLAGLGGLDETTLFKMLFGVATPGPQSNVVGALGAHPNFPPGSPGYMLQKLFGSNSKASDFYNPNDVAYREGGIDGSAAEARNQNLADAYNGGPETPQQYFMRRTQTAFGNPAGGPTTPGTGTGPMGSSGSLVAPKPVKPVAPVKPIKPKQPSTAAIPTSTYTPPTEAAAAPATTRGYQAAEPSKAPEPSTAATCA